MDATVSGYNVYISETSFEDADDATWLGTVEGTTTVITIEEFEDLSNSTSRYVGVRSTTGLIERTQIQSIELPALSGPGAGTTTGDGASFSIGRGTRTRVRSGLSTHSRSGGRASDSATSLKQRLGA